MRDEIANCTPVQYVMPYMCEESRNLLSDMTLWVIKSIRLDTGLDTVFVQPVGMHDEWTQSSGQLCIYSVQKKKARQHIHSDWHLASGCWVIWSAWDI